jgi:flotillin
MEKEQKIGEQRAAFERDAQIKGRRSRTACLDRGKRGAKAIEGEGRRRGARGRQHAPTLQVREAEAYQLSETKKREAEAAVQEAQNRAMARAAFADADRVEAEQRAKSKRHREGREGDDDRRGAGRGREGPLIGAGGGTSDLLKLEAEARGQYEIMSKKAEAMKELVAAAGGAKEAFQLMMVEHLDTLAETSAKAISNIKFDKVVCGTPGRAARGARAASCRTWRAPCRP